MVGDTTSDAWQTISVARELKESSNEAAACFLVGGITMMMGLFHMVNYGDRDIRRYAWLVIATTISIFVAVLTFESFATACIAIYNHFTHQGSSQVTRTEILGNQLFLMVTWFLVLQLLTGTLSGAIFASSGPAQDMPSISVEMDSWKPLRKTGQRVSVAVGIETKKDAEKWKILYPAMDENIGESIETPQVVTQTAGYGVYKAWGCYGFARKFDRNTACEEKRYVSLMCYGGMLAHITGFAAIAFFGHIQQIHPFCKNPSCAFGVVPICFSVLHGMFEFFKAIRFYISNLDGIITVQEELWTLEAEDSEDESIGLACSFLTLSAIRFSITGHLPDMAGNVPAKFDPGRYQVFALVVVLVVFSVAVFIVVHWLRSAEWHRAESSRESSDESMTSREKLCNTLRRLGNRLADNFQTYLLMCVSWTLMFVGKESVLATGRFKDGDNIHTRIAVATTLTVLVPAIIFQLDHISDETQSVTVDLALVKIMVSLGLTIGYSWEQCFESSVDILARNLSSKGGFLKQLGLQLVVAKILLTLIVFMIVVPAYKMYIAPTVTRLELCYHQTQLHANPERAQFEKKKLRRMNTRNPYADEGRASLKERHFSTRDGPGCPGQQTPREAQGQATSGIEMANLSSHKSEVTPKTGI